MHRFQSLIPHGQSAVAGQPRECPLDNPAVAPQLLVAFNPLAGNAAPDPVLPQPHTTARDVVGFVGMDFVWARATASPFASGAFDRRDAVKRLLKRLAIVRVCWRQPHAERDPRAVDHKMALRARFAFIRRIRAGPLAPLFAATVALSTLARDQSIVSASPSRSSRVRWSRCHTPAACQSRRRRQQVTPLPQPISCGSISQGMPLRNTKMIPPSALRLSIRGRPPFGFGGSGGSSGSMIAHSSSDTSCFVIAYTLSRRRPWF